MVIADAIGSQRKLSRGKACAWGFAVLVALLMNVPAQVQFSGQAFPKSDALHPRFETWVFTHGWPMAYMVRRGVPIDECTIGELFAMRTGVLHLSVLILFLDFGATLLFALSLVHATLWCCGTGRANSRFSITLKFMLFVVFLFSVTFSCLARQSAAVRRERDLLGKMDTIASGSEYFRVSKLPTPSRSAIRQPWGPTCLRVLARNSVFDHFDRVVSLVVSGRSVGMLRPFTELRQLTVRDEITARDVGVINAMPKLVVLDISTCITDTGELICIHNPQLHQLDAVASDLDGRCLPFLVNLQLLAIAWSSVESDHIPGLSNLPQLDTLVVSSDQYEPLHKKLLPSTRIVVRAGWQTDGS